MANTTIYHLDEIPEDQLKLWQETAASMNLHFQTLSGETDEELKKQFRDVEYLILNKRPLTEELLAAAEGLEFVQYEGRLTDRIPVASLKERGIKFALAGLPSTIAVAEHAVALVLACAKQIIPAHEMTVTGAYRELGVQPKVTTERSHGFQWMKIKGIEELDQLQLGIFGYGEIGNEIALRLKAFNMPVKYNKRTRFTPDYEKELGIEYADKETLFRESDVMILNCPLTSETEKAVGAHELSLMKSSAILVNVSRGGVIDEQKLVDALKAKQIASAGLDVFLEEPVPHDHPYLSLDNVVLTPHIAGGKGNGRVRNIQRVLENINQFINTGKAELQIV